MPAHNGREMRSPLAVLSEFIAGAVDQLVRSAAMPAAASLESIDERWLAALSQPDGNLEADRAGSKGRAVRDRGAGQGNGH